MVRWGSVPFGAGELDDADDERGHGREGVHLYDERSCEQRVERHVLLPCRVVSSSPCDSPTIRDPCHRPA